MPPVTAGCAEAVAAKNTARRNEDRMGHRTINTSGYNPQVMPDIRVMPFGLGPIGAAIVKQIAARPGFKIVGAIDNAPDKVGRDLGDVVGMSKRLGVKVSDNLANLPKS